jgi:hypothetical protein
MDREETPKQSGCEELTDEEKTLTLVVTPRYYPLMLFFSRAIVARLFFSAEKNSYLYYNHYQFSAIIFF